MGEGKGQEWKGVADLADAIQDKCIGGAEYTIAEAAEKVLRERLEPLLDAAEDVLLYNNYVWLFEKLQKELATWR